MHSAFMHHGSTKEPQYKRCRPVQQAHRRTRDTDEGVHGTGNPERHLVDFAQSKRFWNQLSQQDMKIGDQRECDRNRNQMGIDISMWNVRQPLLEDGGHHRFTDPAKTQAASTAPEFHGGTKVVQILLQTADGARSRTALSDKLFDARLPYADESEFCRDEEAIRENQYRYRNEPKEQET